MSMTRRPHGASARQTVRRAVLFPILLLGTLAAVHRLSDPPYPNALRGEQLSLLLVQSTFALPQQSEPLGFSALTALGYLPALLTLRSQAEEVWSEELQLAPTPESDSEDSEGTVLSADRTPQTVTGETDNGVASRTLRPSDPTGYLIADGVYINNGSACVPEVSMIGSAPVPVLPADSPQVLIVHTHGSEAYTMPTGEEYIASDDHRTTDNAKNMVCVGDAIAEVLTAAGLGVLHDRTLYDYPHYSGAYSRSLESVLRYLRDYPSITYILDVHRDAVEDAQGNEYKLLCAEQPNAAQLEFVIGSPGGGAEHPHWTENLTLAAAVQRKIQSSYPTLMRPIVIRNSRYNQHALPGSLLLEVGTAGNSLSEALCAARLFAEGFAATVLP